MCGIAGIASREAGPAVLAAIERMVAALAHRGPDDRGVWLGEAPPWRLALGATRLAILDPSPCGHQPMGDAAGRFISYNGEVYNHRELKALLDQETEPWRSRTDTEVVLRAYGVWGRPFLERLRGMFALGLWDGPARRLVLARDPFGIKPLYVYRSGDRLVFGSEVRALLASGMVPRRLCHEGLASFLSFGSPEAPLTLIDGVESILPGHVVTVDVGRDSLELATTAYGRPRPSTGVLTRGESVHAVRAAIEDSVKAHLVSDVPVGVFLSGGVDSGAVLALASRFAPEALRAVTVSFPDHDSCEIAEARRVAELFGAEHAEVRLTEEGLLEMLPGFFRAMDQASMDGLNTYAVARGAKEIGLKVALSGLGGDELFGGYASFRRITWLPWLKGVPGPLRQALRRAAGTVLRGFPRWGKAGDLIGAKPEPTEIYAISRRLFGPADRRALGLESEARPPLLPALPSEADPFLVISVCELGHYMANTLLRDTDQMSMAHSLEVRTPFIDGPVVDTVLAIPTRHKVHGPGPKPLFREAFGGLLPSESLRRPKRPFTLPLEHWMRGRLRSEVEQILTETECASRLGLRGAAVGDLWRRFLDHPGRVGWSRPWALYALLRWAEQTGVTL